MAVNGNVTNGKVFSETQTIELHLTITDRELCEVLSGYEEGKNVVSTQSRH